MDPPNSYNTHGEFLDVQEGEIEGRAARGDDIRRIQFVQIGQRPQDGIPQENTVPERCFVGFVRIGDRRTARLMGQIRPLLQIAPSRIG